MRCESPESASAGVWRSRPRLSGTRATPTISPCVNVRGHVMRMTLLGDAPTRVARCTLVIAGRRHLHSRAVPQITLFRTIYRVARLRGGGERQLQVERETVAGDHDLAGEETSSLLLHQRGVLPGRQ